MPKLPFGLSQYRNGEGGGRGLGEEHDIVSCMHIPVATGQLLGMLLGTEDPW